MPFAASSFCPDAPYTSVSPPELIPPPSDTPELAAADLALAEPDNDIGPIRRCVATGERRDKSELLRFVLGPSGELVADFDAKLPGRGLYLTLTPLAIGKAVKQKSFAKASRRAVALPPDFAARIEAMLVLRCQNWLSLARKAGQIALGHDKVVALLKQGAGALLVQACDGSQDGRDKLTRLAELTGIAEFATLNANELAAPFGRDHLIHIAVRPGGIAVKLSFELHRLQGLRSPPTGEAYTAQSGQREPANRVESVHHDQ